MSLKETIQTDIKNSMLSGHKARLKILRLITAAIKQREVDERIILDESQVFAVLDKMLKQRRDSLSQYQAAKRHDLVEKENLEIEIISGFMPQAIPKDELDQIITDAINSTSAQSMQDMGKVMAIIKTKVQGRADMAQVSQTIKAKLN